MAAFQSSATPPCAAFPERIGGISSALAAMQLLVLSQLEVCSLSEWWFITSIGTRWDWFQRTYVLITTQKNLANY